MFSYNDCFSPTWILILTMCRFGRSSFCWAVCHWPMGEEAGTGTSTATATATAPAAVGRGVSLLNRNKSRKLNDRFFQY